MGRPSNRQKANARRLWEEEGWSIKDIAAKYEVRRETVSGWKREQGWIRDENPDFMDALESTVTDTPTEVTFEPPAALDAAATSEKDAEIAALRAKLANAEAKLDELSPVVQIGTYHTPAEVIEVLGRSALEEIALSRFGLENIQRAQRGMPSTNWEGSERLEREVERIATELLNRKTKFVGGGANVRVVKMVKPDGALIQVPVEQQVSNESAEPGTAIMRAKAKGYKLASPYLCQVINCWDEAVIGPDGRPVDGYCDGRLADGTPHRGLDPYLNRRRMEGASTTQPIHQSVAV